MAHVIVRVPEVWTRRVLVEVRDEGNEEQAFEAARTGQGRRLDTEYSHTLPEAAWSTEEADDAEIGSPEESEGPKPKKRRRSK